MKELNNIFKKLELTDCGKYGHIWNNERCPVRCVRCGYRIENRTKYTLGDVGEWLE